MTVGPNRERHPADVIANPVLVAKRAVAKLKRTTHRVAANVISEAANPAAAKLTSECRRKIAKKAAATRCANSSYANHQRAPMCQIGLALVVIVSALGIAQASEMTLEERAELLVAQASEMTFEERFARFRLFDDCRPMDVTVETLPPDAKQLGLTEYSLRAAIESRLRAARLFDDETSSYLYLNVNVIGGAFNILLSYKKSVCDLASVECFATSTWNVGVTGTHGDNAGYVRSAVSEYMDTFILEYMKVNEEACSNQ